MYKDKVEYIGIALSDESIELIKHVFGDKIISDVQENMHMTIRYYGFKDSIDRSDIPVDIIGMKVTITVDSFGEFVENGMVMNQGLHVSEIFPQVPCANEVPHITVAINQATDEKGRRIAKAVNTYRCDFSKKLTQPLILTGRVGLFRNKEVSFTLN